MDELEEVFAERYKHIHPLILQRSFEKARSPGDLFDILESVPVDFPIVWDEVRRVWTCSDDLLQDGRPTT